MKIILGIIIAIVLAVGGYTVYRGLTGDNDNAQKIADKTSELVTSVADTFSDGAKDMAKDVKEKTLEAADSVLSSADRAIDSAKSSVKSRIGDVREANAKKFAEAKKSVSDKVDSIKK